ncbi:MAG: sulfatase-like hydrolase/transferase [Verrucomicrobiota bacterium]
MGLFLLPLLPKEGAAETFFFADFDYTSAPASGTLGADGNDSYANLNGGMPQLVGSFSGSSNIPEAQGIGRFSPDTFGFQDGFLWLDQPSSAGSFMANLDLSAGTPVFDSLVVSMKLLTRRGTNNNDEDYSIIGYDGTGNEAFHLAISTDKNGGNNPEKKLGVIHSGGTVSYTLSEDFGGSGSDEELDMDLSGDTSSARTLVLNFGNSGYTLAVSSTASSFPGNYTTGPIPYNGNPSNLARIEFVFASGSGFYLDDLKVEGSISVSNPDPVAPTNLTAVIGDSEVALNWADDPSGAVDFYTVYRSETFPVTSGATVVGTTSTSSFNDSTIVSGTTYYYAVSATSTGGVETALSEGVPARTLFSLLSDFQFDPSSGDGQVTINGPAHRLFKLVADNDLDFESPLMSPMSFDAASVGTLGENGDRIMSDANGQATVQFNMGSAGAGFLRAETATPSKPNIIIFYSDDQDKSHVGCYGNNSDTPHIDSIAANGVKFNRFYISSPVCTPSRYNLLTGRFASRNTTRFHDEHPPGGYSNVRWNARIFQEPLLGTLPGILQANGYHTGMCGKWHQGQNELPYLLNSDIRRQAVPTDSDWDTDIVPKLEANYQVVVDSVKSCGFDFADGVFESNVTGMDLPRYLQVHCIEFITKAALDFLDESQTADNGQPKPFFLYMAATVPHTPNPSDSLANSDFRTPIGILPELEGVQPSRASVMARVSGSQDRGSTWFDDGVGAVMAKLDELGVTENTLVFYISDHGSTPSKMSSYDGGARVPAVVQWPAVIQPGSVSNKLVANYDVAPLIYDALDITVDPQVKIDGVSFLRELMNEQYEREHIFMEIGVERTVVNDAGFKYMAVRYWPEILADIQENGASYGHEQSKVPFSDRLNVRYGHDREYPDYFDFDQLYDLNNDAQEHNNLYDDPAYAEQQAELRALVEAYSQDLLHLYGEFKTE